MRAKLVTLALAASVCAGFVPVGPVVEHGPISGNLELAATSNGKKQRPQQPAQRPHLRSGPADPSFGPDGKLYPVPDYLRGQCYIDDGYGRFSPCSNHR